MQDTCYKSTSLIILYLVLCFMTLECDPALDYWIAPACPLPANLTNSMCLTLTDLLELTNSTVIKAPSIAINFQDGVHRPLKSGWINVQGWLNMYGNLELNLSIAGDPIQDSVIECTPGSNMIGFMLDTIGSLTFQDLTIRGCGYDSTDIPQHSLLYFNYRSDSMRLNTFATLLLFYTEAYLSNVHISNSKGFGLINVEPSEAILIKNSSFINTKSNQYQCQPHIFIIAIDSLTIKIEDTVIQNGMGSLEPLFWSGINRTRYISGGITIWFIFGKTVYISLQNLLVEGNMAYMGGGVYITTMSARDEECQSDILMNVTNCTFQNNHAISSGGAIHRDYKYNSACFSLNAVEYSVMSIVDGNFINNSALNKGGGIHMKLEVIIRNAQNKVDAFSMNISNAQFEDNCASNGGAIYYDFKMDSALYSENIPVTDRTSFLATISFIITKVNLKHNIASRAGGAVYMLSNEMSSSTVVNVVTKMKECIFSRNAASEGSGMVLYSLQVNNSGVSVSVYGCGFIDNHCMPTHDHTTLSVIHLTEVKHLLLQNTAIGHNTNCRGIYSNMSLIEIQGEVHVRNHTSDRGAGIYFDCNPLSSTHRTSQLLLYDINSTLFIQDNSAELYGGGIAIKTGCSAPEDCFFSRKGQLNRVVIMERNKALVGGSSIYGGYLEYCKFGNETLNLKTFDTLFQINDMNAPSLVASQPYKVCICSENITIEHRCVFEYNVTTFPGQTFQVPLVGASDFNNSFPSVIRASIDNTHNTNIQDIQLTQQVGLDCTHLSYTISTTAQNQIMMLALEIDKVFSSRTIVKNSKTTQVYVHIKQCPLSFVLDMESEQCLCTEYLRKSGVECDIENLVIRKSNGKMWVGNLSNNSEIVTHSNCPFDYCKRDYLSVDPYNQADQCDYNRSGVLCGACQPGLSLMLGSSRCGKCSDLYLLLLVAFAAAGIALVLILLKCDLTVSNGMLNGLIFYVNILQANRAVYFPNLNQINSLSTIFAVLVAWLNLDLGIETCLSSSLTAYAKTWLQFVFPVYIWLMVALLIIVSRYSLKISNFTGSNTVSVLVTLFLLSYAKILRATLSSVSATMISGSNSSHIVWLLDGNYAFLAWPHALLFVFALMMLLFFIIPFNFILLFSPLLLVLSNKQSLIWINKLVPLIDAYEGPYERKFRVWTGWMLFLRLALFSAFAGNVLGDPNLNIMLTMLVTIGLLIMWWRVGNVYRMLLNNCIEMFYLTNLAVTSAITLTFTNNTYFQEISICIAVGSALTVFLLTLVYHFLTKTNIGNKIVRAVRA